MDTCFWCKQAIVDGRQVSGYTGKSEDWATMDDSGDPFDFGCDAHPISGEDGCGPHETIGQVKLIVKDWHIKQDEVSK